MPRRSSSTLFTNDTDCFDIVGIDRAMPISSVVLEYISVPTLDETSQKIAAYLDYLTENGSDLHDYAA